jgi:signal transduction histidine kinase
VAQETLEARVQERTAELHAAIHALREEAAQRANAEESRHSLLHRLATAQEQERLRLSRELHDEIGQHVAALMLGLNSLEPHLNSTAGAPVLAKLQSLTETLGREVHALAVQLRPAALDDLGLVRAITTYVKSWSDRSGVTVELHTGNLEERRLPPEVELTIYRIIQEALTNVMKHANAKRVSIVLNRQERAVSAVIEDDGQGFDPEAQPSDRRGGLGLLGMRERAAQLNGRLTVESVIGQGTTVFVRIPLPPVA